MRSVVSNRNFMNGVPEFLVLRLLTEREMYGYELVQAIRLRTEDAISLGEGVVYPVLQALERQGALSTRRKAVNGRTRIYYAVTADGSKRLETLFQQWNRIAGAIGGLAQGRSHVQAV
jgi:PadR family transcriptional regulator, regulatory protein PadR